MVVIRRGVMEIAIIDPKKGYWESGQYVKYDARKLSQMNQVEIVVTARNAGKEIRYYYQHMITFGGENVPAKLIVTEIPPGHIQPIHTHLDVYEWTWVVEGELIAIDCVGATAHLTEKDWVDIVKHGTILAPGDTVLAEPGVRHTVMNRGPERYCVINTVQVGRILRPEGFNVDWVREEPVSADDLDSKDVVPVSNEIIKTV